MKLDVTMKSGRRMVQLQFCIPVTPTRMRLIVYFYQNIIPFSKYMPFMNRIMSVQSDKIINQDLELLAGQQVRLLQGARPWNTAVSADTGGVIYRKWRERAERSKPWFGGYSASGFIQMSNELKEGKVFYFLYYLLTKGHQYHNHAHQSSSSPEIITIHYHHHHHHHHHLLIMIITTVRI
jgi:hypothetical protein